MPNTKPTCDECLNHQHPHPESPDTDNSPHFHPVVSVSDDFGETHEYIYGPYLTGTEASAFLQGYDGAAEDFLESEKVTGKTYYKHSH